MEKQARYLTTTLPYVNAAPHIGFALEMVQSDAVARYWRLMDHEVFFNTGTDEHGQKIFQKAKEEGKETQAYVDEYAAKFEDLKEALDLSYDAFVRTTSEEHKAAAQELWRRCAEKGDIYKQKYSGLYCVGCERFIKEGELVDGECPDHPGTKPEEIEEENYFFKLSNYESKLKEYLSQEGVVVPDWRRKEALAFVENGLEDFSISREKERMSWGVPVPDDDSQVMYVWFDALTNYISTLGWPNDPDGNFEKFWTNGETVQMAGKDQVRFQSIMWQAMLMSAELPSTDKIVYHGFITSGGQKMSKSIGNVISPFDLVERYGTDATRYLLLRHVHPFEDSDITMERLDEWYTADLVNGLGNLTARIMKMAETHLQKSEIEIAYYSLNHDKTKGGELDEFKRNMDHFQFSEAANVVWNSIAKADEMITEKEPFKVIKTDPETAKETIFNLLQRIWRISVMLEPFMPTTTKTIQESIKANKKPENLFPRLEQ